MRADEIMAEGAKTYKERNLVYGDSYKEFGPVMKALFPDGISVDSIQDLNRIGVLNMIVSKLMRYCNNFHNGGHPDSIQDMMVYCAMLAELDKEGAK